ncbi:MAG: radical SAM protein, partial [Archaeoglobaceae archaeon]
LFNILVKHDYSSLGEFHKKTLFIGFMHFQDLYNYDIARVERCEIHYATPDGRIIPFCTFNVLPEIYRDRIQEQFGISIEEWERKTGRKLKDDIYRVVRRPR